MKKVFLVQETNFGSIIQHFRGNEKFCFEIKSFSANFIDNLFEVVFFSFLVCFSFFEDICFPITLLRTYNSLITTCTKTTQLWRKKNVFFCSFLWMSKHSVLFAQQPAILYILRKAKRFLKKCKTRRRQVASACLGVLTFGTSGRICMIHDSEVAAYSDCN